MYNPVTQEINDYLNKQSDEVKSALENVRAAIREASPDAVEAKSYGMPAFKYKGKPLAGYNASKSHMGFYPMSATVIKFFGDYLTEFETSKGTIRFTVENPLPADVIRKLVRARMKEIDLGIKY